MSLGWQCESTLSKFKAKPIANVGKKSMIDLLAIVYDKEEKLGSNFDASSGSLISRKRKMSEKIKINSDEKKELTKSSRTGEVDKESVVLSALKAKAALYEQLRSGQNGDMSNSFLVKFDDIKPDTTCTDKQLNPSSSSKSEEPSNKLASEKSSEWAWSNGQIFNSFSKNDADEEKIEPSKAIRDKIDHLIQKEHENHISISQEARVRSQWEKTLKGNTKLYLEEIHKEIETSKAASKEKISSFEEDHPVNSLKKKSEKDLRRELLMNKRMLNKLP